MVGWAGAKIICHAENEVNYQLHNYVTGLHENEKEGKVGGRAYSRLYTQIHLRLFPSNKPMSACGPYSQIPIHLNWGSHLSLPRATNTHKCQVIYLSYSMPRLVQNQPKQFANREKELVILKMTVIWVSASLAIFLDDPAPFLRPFFPHLECPKIRC